MPAKIKIFNLSWGTTEGTLRYTFEQFGQVLEVVVVKDPYTGRPRGFGYVTYATYQEAVSAIYHMNGQELDGRKIVVTLDQGYEEE